MTSAVALLSFFLLSFPLFSSTASLTAYEALEQYDFPAGLLPLGVTGYTLNEETGEFEAYLGETCSYSVEGYDLKYKSTISGKISKDKLTDLKGISVKVVFFWVNIVEVTRDGDDLYLSVGLLSASFDISGFIESPQCGCGFDCNDIETEVEKKIDLKRFLTSFCLCRADNAQTFSFADRLFFRRPQKCLRELCLEKTWQSLFKSADIANESNGRKKSFISFTSHPALFVSSISRPPLNQQKIGFFYLETHKLFTTMIQILFALILADMALIVIFVFKTPLRKLVIMGLDRVKRGQAPIVVKAVGSTIFVVMMSSVYSVMQIHNRRNGDADGEGGGELTPTDQILAARHLLEASLMGGDLILPISLAASFAPTRCSLSIFHTGDFPHRRSLLVSDHLSPPPRPALHDNDHWSSVRPPKTEINTED
ncbi:hypothetical protein LXL04_001160 [Taraxacum kok-saghyz]